MEREPMHFEIRFGSPKWNMLNPKMNEVSGARCQVQGGHFEIDPSWIAETVRLPAVRPNCTKTSIVDRM